MMGEQRDITFKPAFHRCHPDPSKDYGIGSVRMHWLLKLDGWAIGWDVYTGWDLPRDAFIAAVPDCTHPMHRGGPPKNPRVTAGAVDWHMPVPRWEGHQPVTDHCKYTGGVCYLDSGYLLGDEVFDLLRTEGDEAVWARLRTLLDEVRAEVQP